MTEVRLATPEDADEVAVLLHDFNTEFGSASPGRDVLARRLTALLSGPTTFAVLAGGPPDAVALVTLHSNVWTDGLVALLDELYTVPSSRSAGIGARVLAAAAAEAARRGATEMAIEVDEPDDDALRFYSRQGFPLRDPVSGDRAVVIRRELNPPGPVAAREYRPGS